MSQSLMVYPNSNDFLHMPSMLDDNVAKLMNAEQIENYLASASTSPAQDYLMSPTSYPQQEQQNQRQHQLQFPAATMISHSAPNSPPYPVIKTEDAQTQNSVDYALMFPTTSFDVSAQEQQILPSQRPYANVSLLQQHQQHKQQQQQHEQQLRLQHRQLQMMYDTLPSHSAVTSSIMSTMVSAATSSSIFAPSAIATSAPFVHASILPQDAPTFQRRPSYIPAAHPAAPKRKREDLAESDEPTSPSTSPSTKLSTSSRLDKVKITRNSKVTKSSSPSSPVSFSSVTDLSASETSKAKKAVAIKKAQSESRESSEQPENDTPVATYPSRTPGHTNVTHPRRAAQNRAAQRTFRNRRKAYIKELELKVSEIDKTREIMEAVQAENREVWRRLQMLESLASRNGLQLPVFPPLTSLAATTLSADGVPSISVVTGNEYGLAVATDNADMMMMNHLGSDHE